MIKQVMLTAESFWWLLLNVSALRLPLALCILVLSLYPVVVLAQQATVDTQAPIIEIEELAEGFADRRQVFTVLIQEDAELQSAALYHRRAGESSYASVPMQSIGESDFYSATIDTNIMDLRTIEYYVLAVDSANNRTLSGFAFDPYRRTLKPPPSPLRLRLPSTRSTASDSASGEPTSEPIWQQRWFQITLAVVAAGAIVSFANSGDEEDTRIVPLTFNLE